MAVLPALPLRPWLYWVGTGTALLGVALAAFVFRSWGSPDFNVGPTDLFHRLLWGPVFGVLIYVSVWLESGFAPQFPKVLLLLGNASYSIYLFHSAAINVLDGKVNRMFAGPDLVPALLRVSILAGSGVAAGIVAYFLLERPVMNKARTLIGARTAPPRGID